MPENKGDRPPIALYLSGLVILVVSGILLLYQGGEIAAQFYAPGPVHYEHRDATCVDCHKAFRGINEKGCTAGGCHTSEDLKTMDAKPAVIELHEDKQAEKCSTCHTEHQGLEGNLTLDYHIHDPAGKGLSGYALCQDCHLSEGRDAHPDIKDDRCDACHISTRSWEDISFSHQSVTDRACVDCHSLPEDELHDLVSDKCDQCHGVRAWRPARFDHRVLNPADREKCSACHRLPRDGFHGGAQGIPCSDCHTTTRWVPSTFRHPRFPEMWKHLEELYCNDCHPTTYRRSVSCRECHGRGGWDD